MAEASAGGPQGQSPGSHLGELRQNALRRSYAEHDWHLVLQGKLAELELLV